MKKLLLIIVILTLNSCFVFEENGIEVKIKNISSEPITDIEVTTSEKLDVIKIDRIEPNENVSEFLSMRENKTDGGYIVTFTRENGKTETRKDGYYTNGGSLDEWIEFNVKSDTVLVKLSGMRY